MRRVQTVFIQLIAPSWSRHDAFSWNEKHPRFIEEDDIAILDEVDNRQEMVVIWQSIRLIRRACGSLDLNRPKNAVANCDKVIA